MGMWNLVMIIEHDVETVASAVEEIINSIGGKTHVVSSSVSPVEPAAPAPVDPTPVEEAPAE